MRSWSILHSHQRSNHDGQAGTAKVPYQYHTWMLYLFHSCSVSIPIPIFHSNSYCPIPTTIPIHSIPVQIQSWFCPNPCSSIPIVCCPYRTHIHTLMSYRMPYRTLRTGCRIPDTSTGCQCLTPCTGRHVPHDAYRLHVPDNTYRMPLQHDSYRMPRTGYPYRMARTGWHVPGGAYRIQVSNGTYRMPRTVYLVPDTAYRIRTGYRMAENGIFQLECYRHSSTADIPAQVPDTDSLFPLFLPTTLFHFQFPFLPTAMSTYPHNSTSPIFLCLQHTDMKKDLHSAHIQIPIGIYMAYSWRRDTRPHWVHETAVRESSVHDHPNEIFHSHVRHNEHDPPMAEAFQGPRTKNPRKFSRRMKDRNRTPQMDDIGRNTWGWMNYTTCIGSNVIYNFSMYALYTTLSSQKWIFFYYIYYQMEMYWNFTSM